MMEKNKLTFDAVLDKYRKISFSQQDKGFRFERLMQAYLKTDPRYSGIFKTIWLWANFPGRFYFGSGHDLGIDLVALTNSGEYWAIQCKCYQDTTILDKPAVDSFLSTSSRTFKDEEKKEVRFAHRLWISTTNKWGPNATESIKNQHPPVTRINLTDLQEAPINWENLEKGLTGEKSRTEKKTIRDHQREALEKTHEYFKTHDRGKLIMACGTGKTFNALKIAEHETNDKGLILFLVPSISLMSQTLREWSADANKDINAICICSDPKVSRKKAKVDESDNYSIVDLALPASTNVTDIVEQFKYLKSTKNENMTVVFSTYQSIEVIKKAQVKLFELYPGYGTFDLIICDEAHRTTGVTLSDDEESDFVKVHDNDFIKAKKRLYMTATPRLYDENAKSRAAQAEAILCSMDDPELYGEEIYRIGFGEAVNKNLLTDYKVLILTLSEKDVPPEIQQLLTNAENEINTDDLSKLVGCINALSKQILGDEGIIKSSDPEPMRKAVAFCSTIANSKRITNTFNVVGEKYISTLPSDKKDLMVTVCSEHIDGTMPAPQRDEKLGWLKATSDINECRILTNVRCLSEGVDVPSLDAVMFLSARNSQIDVVQSVGRVMRVSPGKKYGYIIIPVVVPTDVDTKDALDDNERYKVVWTVLNALRAHDDRFNATINKIDLNKKKPKNILVGRIYQPFAGDGKSMIHDPIEEYNADLELSKEFEKQFETLQHLVFARMVEKVGDRTYWEQWAKSVADIASRQIVRIQELIEIKQEHQQVFTAFLTGLQKNINPSISKQDAIEMLSQHIITKPVFEALFENYSFVKNNPISKSMQKMLDLLEDLGIEKDTITLKKFYESVKMKASGIDNAEAKQRIIVELYDKFFKTAFPKMVEKLGIVYTPVEVVDFIIQSVNDILKKEFNRTLGDENVHILDPFTGTGTFITRLLQSGLIGKKDLLRKYQNEIHANEIVLLAYYIAAVNIENAFHDIVGEEKYTPFDGICLTDTFQLGESEESERLFSEMFPQNSTRVLKQKKAPLRVIFGNPPYSIGQKSANDNAQNQKYPVLDKSIASTYAKGSNAGLSKSLYDAYIKAFRWSSERLDPVNGGIICFVSNGAWLDGNSTDGFRKCLEKEFSSIYVFNLRGNQRTSGELSRKEGGKIFGSGSRTPIAITLLIKNPTVKTDKANIHYCDIGDYWNREQKLEIVKKYGSISNKEMKWVTLEPNNHGDWISLRSSEFDSYIPLAPEKKFDLKAQAFFNTQGPGILSSRDAWVYNFSKQKVNTNMNRMITFYNEQKNEYLHEKTFRQDLNIENFINTDDSNLNSPKL
jgi:predicted helicase